MSSPSLSSHGRVPAGGWRWPAQSCVPFQETHSPYLWETGSEYSVQGLGAHSENWPSGCRSLCPGAGPPWVWRKQISRPSSDHTKTLTGSLSGVPERGRPRSRRGVCQLLRSQCAPGWLVPVQQAHSLPALTTSCWLPKGAWGQGLISWVRRCSANNPP